MGRPTKFRQKFESCREGCIHLGGLRNNGPGWKTSGETGEGKATRQRGGGKERRCKKGVGHSRAKNGPRLTEQKMLGQKEEAFKQGEALSLTRRETWERMEPISISDPWVLGNGCGEMKPEGF